MNPILLEMYAQERQKMLLEEARIRNLKKLAKKSKLKMRESLLIRIGDLMISMGYRLIDKYEPIQRPDMKRYKKYNCCPDQ